jgi:DNA-binding XRE family transcriptional regulator
MLTIVYIAVLPIRDIMLVGYASAVPESEVEPSVLARRMAVGRRMRDLREGVGLSQAAVAEAAGLSRPFYLAVEAGRRNISLDKVFAIADALGVSAAAFFSK